MQSSSSSSSSNFPPYNTNNTQQRKRRNCDSIDNDPAKIRRNPSQNNRFNRPNVSHLQFLARRKKALDKVFDNLAKPLSMVPEKLDTSLKQPGINDKIVAYIEKIDKTPQCAYDPPEPQADVTWDFSEDNVQVTEEIIWLENLCNSELKPPENEWIQIGSPKLILSSENKFCEENVYTSLLNAKEIFNEFDAKTVYNARARANPFEGIGSSIFMNRAALKMVNIDCRLHNLFTGVDQQKEFGDDPPYYFADLCGGPGGFSEYILWRKQWLFKGFGITLNGSNNFNLKDSQCCSQLTFKPIAGPKKDGNICDPENIENFIEIVKFDTEGAGVHFVVADGGLSSEGNEQYQEVLSKNLYICQCLLALEVLRENGHFVTKLFDTFTDFSVGLLYLMYNCFEKVTILKPNTSRPANAERYFVCHKRRPKSAVKHIKNYLWTIVKHQWKYKSVPNLEVIDIVPLPLIKIDKPFFDYIYEINMNLAKRQTRALLKVRAFCLNPSLVDPRQELLANESLVMWHIPDTHSRTFFTDPCTLMKTVVNDPNILKMAAREIDRDSNFEITFSNLDDWYYCPLTESKGTRFFMAVSATAVYGLSGDGSWGRVKNLVLIPGSIVYGELLPERVFFDKEMTTGARWTSLQIIDALRLGDMDVSGMSFTERRKWIKIYCKSFANDSFQKPKVRPKVMESLSTFISRPLFSSDENSQSFLTYLKRLSHNVKVERMQVHSILFLKVNECMNVYDYKSFESVFILRVLLQLDKLQKLGEKTNNKATKFYEEELSMEVLRKFVLSKVQ